MSSFMQLASAGLSLLTLKVKKVVDQDAVTAEETLRREQLDIDQDDQRLRGRSS